MDDISKILFNGLENNELIKNIYSDLRVAGKNLWDLKINLRWKEIGKCVTLIRVLALEKNKWLGGILTKTALLGGGREENSI